MADKYFKLAVKDLKDMYKSEPKGVYFSQQLECRFEKKYFHSVTVRALKYLCETDFLKLDIQKSQGGHKANFYFRPSHRDIKMQVRRTLELIDEYSEHHVTHSVGDQAEKLFGIALAENGFKIVAKKKRTKKYNGLEWTKTQHDLDYIFERDGIAYGCEIKNKLEYIKPEILAIKLEICKSLKIRPLIILRNASKSDVFKIYKANGFALLFETQVYDFALEPLVKRIQAQIGYPVICTKEIPKRIINRFEKWHKKLADSK